MSAQCQGIILDHQTQKVIYLNGEMDLLTVWEQALSDKEVSSLYKSETLTSLNPTLLHLIILFAQINCNLGPS